MVNSCGFSIVIVWMQHPLALMLLQSIVDILGTHPRFEQDPGRSCINLVVILSAAIPGYLPVFVYALVHVTAWLLAGTRPVYKSTIVVNVSAAVPEFLHARIHMSAFECMGC